MEAGELVAGVIVIGDAALGAEILAVVAGIDAASTALKDQGGMG